MHTPNIITDDEASTVLMSSTTEVTLTTTPYTAEPPNKYLSVAPSYLRNSLSTDNSSSKLILRHVPSSLGLVAVEKCIKDILSKQGIDDNVIEHLRYSTCSINEGNASRPASDSIIVKVSNSNIAQTIREELNCVSFHDSTGDSFTVLATESPYSRDPLFSSSKDGDSRSETKSGSLFNTSIYKQFLEKLVHQDVWEPITFQERIEPESGDDKVEGGTTSLVASLINRPKKRDRSKRKKNDDRNKERSLIKVSKIQQRKIPSNQTKKETRPKPTETEGTFTGRRNRTRNRAKRQQK